MVNHNHYDYRFLWSADDKEFVALCAEFPSLSFLAVKRTEALEGLVNLVGDIVADMHGNGEQPPQPLMTRRYSGKFQIRIPPEQHRNLAIQSAEQGISINRLVSSKLS